ncbi:hypothetical protein FrEUN1fDRAFT_4250 [Parafrankia sp. EUN1f]|nr:hypothetical protein FrEUN1fDRAFT_4250 [Parafrankia sp. EUN1f]
MGCERFFRGLFGSLLPFVIFPLSLTEICLSLMENIAHGLTADAAGAGRCHTSRTRLGGRVERYPRPSAELMSYEESTSLERCGRAQKVIFNWTSRAAEKRTAGCSRSRYIGFS